jgi:hypothetical protein
VKRFIGVVVLASLVWIPSVSAAPPASFPTKGPVASKQNTIQDIGKWFREKIRQLGNLISPPGTDGVTTDVPCVPTDHPEDPNYCSEIDRSKCPIG